MKIVVGVWRSRHTKGKTTVIPTAHEEGWGGGNDVQNAIAFISDQLLTECHVDTGVKSQPFSKPIPERWHLWARRHVGKKISVIKTQASHLPYGKIKH